MIQLQVTKLNEKYIYDNTLTHNLLDFNKTHLYLKINNVIYLSTCDSNIPKGKIGLSVIVRNKLNIKPNDYIKIEIYEPISMGLKNVIFNVRLSNNKNLFTEHEDELREKITEVLQKHYLSNGQVMILNYKNLNILLDVRTNNDGYLDASTKIEITSNDTNVTIISGKMIKRDLFKEDYNFSSIGIGGLDTELLMAFRRSLSTRAHKQSVIDNLGIKHVKGIILHGPPGTGKTLIARKIGGMISNIEPKIINGPEVMNKYVGQSEENIRKLFDDAKNDKDNINLHVIIFDEIDAICRKRGNSSNTHGDNVVNQLLSMIDGVHQLNNIFIIAMTNRLDLIDDALLRAGRLEVHIKIGLPNKEGRKQIFDIHTNKMKSNNYLNNDIDIEYLSKITENYSGAEIEAIITNAASRALYENLQLEKDNNIIVNMNHFNKACEEVIPIFGSNIKKVLTLLPTKYVNLTTSHTQCYTETNKLIKSNGRLKTILLKGESGTGKSSLAAKIMLDNEVIYKTFINSYDIISHDDHGKSNYLIDIFNKAYIVNESLIVIDDVEILINYSTLGEHVIYTNKIYQTLITLLKTNINHKLTVIVICNDNYLSSKLSLYFDKTFDISLLSPDDINNALNQSIVKV